MVSLHGENPHARGENEPKLIEWKRRDTTDTTHQHRPTDTESHRRKGEGEGGRDRALEVLTPQFKSPRFPTLPAFLLWAILHSLLWSLHNSPFENKGFPFSHVLESGMACSLIFKSLLKCHLFFEVYHNPHLARPSFLRLLPVFLHYSSIYKILYALLICCYCFHPLEQRLAN